jgi:ketosteroid isomerase-like protein
MALAADDAATATQSANQAAAQLAAQRGAADTARNEMENTKRGFSGTDAQALAEENRARQLFLAGNFVEATAAYKNAMSLWRDAINRRDVAQKEENDRQAIRALLEKYRLAYQDKNMPAIRAVFSNIPKVEETQKLQMFSFSKSIQLSLEIIEIQVTGDTARVPGQERLHIVTTPDNKTQDRVIPVTFNLRKSSGSWLIQSINR